LISVVVVVVVVAADVVVAVRDKVSAATYLLSSAVGTALEIETLRQHVTASAAFEAVVDVALSAPAVV
jgi:hypothetical protein